MKIRNAGLKDMEKIYKIFSEGTADEFKKQYPNVSKEKILKELDKSKKERNNSYKKAIKSQSHKIIIIEDKKIIGFGEAEILDYNKTRGKVDRIYVLKNYRKKGIGSKIIKKLLEWLKSRGVKTAMSEYLIKNIPSKKFHKKLGFKPMSIGVEKRI